MSTKIMDILKKKYKTSTWIMYQWDSMSNNKNAFTIAKYCDKCLTFDSVDAKKYGWEYRPLFYSESYHSNKKYDLRFIGSLHSQRATIFNKIKNKNLNKYIYIYCSSKIIFLKNKYLSKNKVFTKIKLKDIKFKPLTMKETYDVYSKSKIIVDYIYPNQNGFSMRTIEALGFGCKLITNNKNILSSDLYNKNNICIYEGTNIKIPEEFIKENYIPYSEEIMKKYSIDGFLEDIFNV